MFQQAIKFDCLVMAILQSYYWFVSYNIFDKLAPPSKYCIPKDALNHFLVHFKMLNIYNHLNIVLFFFCSIYIIKQCHSKMVTPGADRPPPSPLAMPL